MGVKNNGGIGLPGQNRKEHTMSKKNNNGAGGRKPLRAEAREAIAAYEDGADFLFTISRLAAIGERMDELLA